MREWRAMTAMHHAASNARQTGADQQQPQILAIRYRTSRCARPNSANMNATHTPGSEACANASPIKLRPRNKAKQPSVAAAMPQQDRPGHDPAAAIGVAPVEFTQPAQPKISMIPERNGFHACLIRLSYFPSSSPAGISPSAARRLGFQCRP